MTLPPSILRLQLRGPQRRIRLWLPLFLLWPPLAIVGLILAPLVLLAAVVLWPRGWGRPVLMAGPALVRLVFALRGLKIEVDGPEQTVFISIA